MLRKPGFYDRFRCIGGACTDTCCAGWDIEIDEESAERYQNLSGPLGCEVRKKMESDEEGTWFALENGRCPFLNCNGLCRLIVEYGEDVLCDICREHPRFYNWYSTCTEVGIGLSCEVGEKLLFENNEKLTFVTEEDADDEPFTANPELYDFYEGEEITDIEELPVNVNAEIVPDSEEGSWETDYEEDLLTAREKGFELVQNRENSMAQRLHILYSYGEELQKLVDNDHTDAVLEFYADFLETHKVLDQFSTPSESCVSLLKEYCSFLLNLEIMDEQWSVRLREAMENPEGILKVATSFAKDHPRAELEYEHLAVYFLYRYFGNAIFDMDVRSKVYFVLFCVVVIRMLDIDDSRKHGRSKDRFYATARIFSKEIEYCPDNVDLIQKEFSSDERKAEGLLCSIAALFD